MKVSICDIWANYLSFDNGEIFVDVALSQNSTTANRKFLFVMVQNHEIPIVYHNLTKQNESE
jgi:hypothetical protein